MEDKPNIIKFPVEQTWQDIETIIRRKLDAYGYGKADVTEYLIEKMRGFYTLCESEERTFELTMPAEVPLELVSGIVLKIRRYKSDVILKLVVELLNREIELYYLKAGKQ